MKYFSMFSGVGGFELGMPKEWECVGFSETDKHASMVLKYHYPKVKNYGDCTKIKWNKISNFDVLVGGSPCQDFSIAGKRRGLGGAKSALAWEFIRGLRSKKPRYFIWENVKGVMSSRGGWDFANILTAFSESGYALWWQVLNAKDFGVPQNRERIFVIGFREGSPKEVFFERKTSALFSEEGTSEGGVQTSQTITTRYGNKTPNYTFIEEDGVVFEVNTKIGVAIGKEGDGINLSFPKSKSRRGRVIKGNSPTLQTSATSGTIDDGKIREFTEIECERLMSWPDNWTKYGINEKGDKIIMSKAKRYKMCGNGVVSNVVRAIIQNLF